jgi:hypothetical protein
MATTPEALQKRFEMQAQLGTVDVPRAIYAFEGKSAHDRKRLLSGFIPMLMSGALAGEGSSRYSTKQVTQAEMGLRAGTSRVTMTRRLSKLAQLAAGYDTAAARRQHAVELHAKATRKLDAHRAACELCTAGQPCEAAAKLAARIGQVKDVEAYQPAAPVPVLHRKRHFAAPNTYRPILPERLEDWAIVETETGTHIKQFFDVKLASRECAVLNKQAAARAAAGTPARTYQVEAVELPKSQYHYPTIEQLRQGPDADWWAAEVPAIDTDTKRQPSYRGFKALSRWVWDSRLCDPETGRSLDTLTRLVFSYYEQKGLLDEYVDRNTGKLKPRGVLQVSQPDVARELGISVKTVYRANRKWAALGILRIVSDEREQIEPGRWVSCPQKVVYLPFRMLTENEAAIESARLEARVREIVQREGAQRLQQLLAALQLKNELLAAWTGREHCLGAFRKELGRRMTAAGIFPDIITKLLTPPREPDPR